MKKKQNGNFRDSRGRLQNEEKRGSSTTKGESLDNNCPFSNAEDAKSDYSGSYLNTFTSSNNIQAYNPSALMMGGGVSGIDGNTQSRFSG
jgi:hypothetical protein